MNDTWVSIFSTNVKHIADWAKQMLEDNNISAVVLNKRDSVYLFGEIEVYVKPEDKEQAEKLIEIFQKRFNIE